MWSVSLFALSIPIDGSHLSSAPSENLNLAFRYFIIPQPSMHLAQVLPKSNDENYSFHFYFRVPALSPQPTCDPYYKEAQ